MLNLDREEEGEGPLLMKDMGKILSSLASEDALKILQEARSGITSSTEAIKKLGLTQKRYYTRLKPLVEAELIEKREDGYKLTFLGKIVYEIIYRKLEKTLESKDRIALIDRLNRTKSLSQKERQEVAAAILDKEKTVGYSSVLSEMKPVEIIRSYEELVKVGVDLLENVKEEMLFAARYTDTRIVESFLTAFKRGVKINVIDGDKRNFSKRLSVMRVLFSSPGVLMTLHELIRSVRVKYIDLPYSFAVFDRRYTVFEVTSPTDGSFLYGFRFDNEEIAQSFSRLFNELFEKGGKDSFTELFLKRVEKPEFMEENPAATN